MDKKPVSVKKKASRKTRIAKTLTASEAIGPLEKGTDTYILTFGQFSLIDALVAILDQTGPASVDLSTWTAADADLGTIISMLESASIEKFRMIVDYSFKKREPVAYPRILRAFGADCIRELRTHAKFMIIRNDDWHIVVRTSMNLNKNPRLENLEVSVDQGFAETMTMWVDAIFGEVIAGEGQSQLPELRNIPDDYPFKPVEAKQLQANQLSLPSFTHTVKAI